MDNLLSEDQGAVRILTLNRPEKRNALDAALSRALLEALRAADADDEVRCVVLTGAGPGFCAGADLSEFKGLRDPKAAESRAELTMQLHLAFSKMITPVVTAINGAAMGGGAGLAIAGDLAFSKMVTPVVTAINGAAMGGGAGLAIAGDMAVMAQTAKLGYPETKHGIVAAIVMANLVRQVGRKAAFELVALGEPIDGARALELGMVNRVVPLAKLMREALALAGQLAAVAKPAMAQTKRLFHEVADLPLERALELGRDANKRMRNFEKLDGGK